MWEIIICKAKQTALAFSTSTYLPSGNGGVVKQDRGHLMAGQLGVEKPRSVHRNDRRFAAIP